MVIQFPQQDNLKLLERKQRILTELAAIENKISIFDFLDPVRDTLQSSVTDVPCSVTLLSSTNKNKQKLNIDHASTELSNIILEMGVSHAPTPLNPNRPTPKCDEIVNHAKIFFHQLKTVKEARAGLLTAFSVIPRKSDGTEVKAEPQQPTPPEETQQVKRVHPFFPDIRGLQSLLGHMKQQLGEFPTFVRNQPDDAECEELRMQAPKDCLQKHLLEICGSSSDDEFDPDAPLDTALAQAANFG